MRIYKIYQGQYNNEYYSNQYEDSINLEDKGYKCIYTDGLPFKQQNDNITLGVLFEKFNINHPEDYKGRSLSVGDIVQIEDIYYICCSMDWKEINIINDKIEAKEEWIVELTETDNEIWSSDLDCESREECITLGVPLAQEDGLCSFRIGQKIPSVSPRIDVDLLLDNACDQLYDEVGEVSEGFLDDVTKEQQDELDEQLNEVFSNWMNKYKFEPKCYTIINDEIIKIGGDNNESKQINNY